MSVTTDKITDTAMRGLQIGVLAGVAGGVMRTANKAFGGKSVRYKRSRRRKKSKRKKR